MNWFDLLVSGSAFITLVSILVTNIIYPKIQSAYTQSYAFANKMFYKYCLYKFLDSLNFDWDNIYSYLYSNNFKFDCKNETFYVKYQILKVPTGKSEKCLDCIYFKIENGRRYVCVDNITVTLEGNFITANAGNLADNIWLTNSGCAEIIN